MAGITIMLVLIFSRTHRATVNLFGRWAFISLESGMVYSRVGAAVAEWRQKGERKKVREREREVLFLKKGRSKYFNRAQEGRNIESRERVE